MNNETPVDAARVIVALLNQVTDLSRALALQTARADAAVEALAAKGTPGE